MASEVAQRIVKRIWSDLTDRGGVGNELEACDRDIQQEIKDAMADIVDEEIAKKNG